MNASGSSQPIAMRRHEVERRIATQRATIGAAWTEFEYAEGRMETNLRRAIGWTRRASSIALSVAALYAFRRMHRATPVAAAVGILNKTASAAATWRSLRRLLDRLRQGRTQQGL